MSEEEFEAIIEEVLGTGPEDRPQEREEEEWEDENRPGDERESGRKAGRGRRMRGSMVFRRGGN